MPRKASISKKSKAIKKSAAKHRTKKRKVSKLHSSAWPNNLEVPVISKTHQIIADLSQPILPLQLTYRELLRTDLTEFKRLEKEWFPFYAGPGFYTQIVKDPWVHAVGCFWHPAKTKLNLLLAAIMIRFDPLTDASEYSRKYLPKSKKVLKWHRAAKFCTNYNARVALIQTIGVIDEARRLGIATELMQQVVKIAKREKINMFGFTLQVVEFNKPAINCYEKNGFKFLFTVPQYYRIRRVDYNARYYIKPIV
eukprot:TRINITY_DN6880_c0_g1_i1.p1 TRINITY_DN6880_c0_g1~~TRINITY_DN6880_c0_g1_i1.p1  ORF type:complete len:273 (+),score=13.87 TRINITY_DN6880_c0_g1_i1:64-819(+)